MSSADLSQLEKILSYQFRDIRLLKQALTHSSYLNEHGMQKTECYERLEFFGDAVLEMITSRYLYKTYPSYMEGAMSKMRASIVSEKPLAKAAREIGYSPYLLLGRGCEAGGGRDSDAILSDVFEAVLAALYLDGGIREAERLVEKYVFEPLKTDEYTEDFKTLLQEIVQERGGTITYEEISEDGPEHDKTFLYQVYVNGKSLGHGSGRTKKQAQQKAAQMAYMEIYHLRPNPKK